MKGHVEPILGDMLCIQMERYSWAFSGDRFVSRNGDLIRAKQQFANGEIRHSECDASKFRVLRGTQLFHILPAGRAAGVGGVGENATPKEATDNHVIPEK